jgi:hypothetical protein
LRNRGKIDHAKLIALCHLSDDSRGGLVHVLALDRALFLSGFIGHLSRLVIKRDLGTPHTLCANNYAPFIRYPEKKLVLCHELKPTPGSDGIAMPVDSNCTTTHFRQR